jgi:UPF0042 nucleotide-binding protein
MSGDTRREVVLITGISGSGKSVALHALEDAGFFCVDNLPPELLRRFIRLEHERFTHRVAVAVDVRNAASLPGLIPLMRELHTEDVHIRSLFLDASNDALLRRFSETRRPHPLSATGAPGDGTRVLTDAIEMERGLLAELREASTVIDTSQLRTAQLRRWVRGLVSAPGIGLTLVFESFGFKLGVPLDADFVFDVRMLPNPHYERELRALTGRDAPVAEFLRAHADVNQMVAHIEGFLRRWLGALEADQRSYVTVAIGCTGGQHRSVYLSECLAQRFAPRATTLVRHRELDRDE